MLMRSKLCIPRVPDAVVWRTRLLTSEHRALTVIHAAAGHGKTTLALQIMAGRAGLHAWLSLDRLDNDPRRFWLHLIGAVQCGLPDTARQAAELLRTGEDIGVADILTLFVNDLGMVPGPLTLVLDDFHHLTCPALIADLNLWLDLLPETVMVIVTTRVRPDLRLAHRAARRAVHEIGPRQIVFDADETADMLRQHGHDHHLDHEACTRLAHRTGGWAAALKLLVLAGQGHADGPSRNGPPAPGEGHDALDAYVVDEILGALDGDTLRFVQVAALFDAFCASLLDHVMARGDAAAVMAELVRRHLFIQPLSDHDGHCRFHDLFRDSVARTARWHPDELVRVKRLAAQWFDAAHRHDEALALYLQLDDAGAASLILEREGPRWLRHGWHEKLRRHLLALPQAVLEERARLLCLHVALMSDADKHVQGSAWLSRALGQIEADPALRADHALLCEVWSLVAVVERLKANWPAMLHAAATSLRHAEAGGLDMRWRAHLTIGAYQVMAGQLSLAAQSLGLARKYAVIEDHKHGLALSTGYLCEALYQLGQLDEAQRVARHTSDLLADSAFARLPMGNWRHIGLPDVLRERGETRQAEVLLEALADLGRHSHAERLLCLIVLIRRWMLKLSSADYLGAEQVLDDIESVQVGMRFASPYPTGSLAAMRARVRLLQGDLAHVRGWLAQQGQEGLEGGMSTSAFVHHQDVLTAIRAYLVLDAPQQAQQLATALLQSAQAGCWRLAEGRALLLRGMACHALGEADKAECDLQASLDMLHAQGYRAVFRDEATLFARVLHPALPHLKPLVRLGSAAAQVAAACGLSLPAVLSAQAPPSEQAGTAALSHREIELLHSVQRGLSDKQISAQLSISTGTVKTHLRNIFRKLGARNRVHALALYRDLGADMRQ